MEILLVVERWWVALRVVGDGSSVAEMVRRLVGQTYHA
jgi:hypothetical protein